MEVNAVIVSLLFYWLARKAACKMHVGGTDTREGKRVLNFAHLSRVTYALPVLN